MFTVHVGFALCFVLSFAYGAPNSSESEILEWEAPEYMKTKYPYYLSGHDYDGSPVFVCDYTKWDFRSAVEGGPETTEELDKWMTQVVVRLRTVGNETVGSPGSVFIADCGVGLDQLGNFGVIQLVLKQFPRFQRLAQLPGIKRFIIINGNYLFQRLFELGKPTLGALANIFEVYGTNAAKWKPILLKSIPAEELPTWLGGSKSVEDMKFFG